MKNKIISMMLMGAIVLNVVACVEVTTTTTTTATGEPIVMGDYDISGNETPLEYIDRPSRRVRFYDDFLRRTNKKVPLSPKKNVGDLKKIYKKLRSTFTYVSDINQYGVDDHWVVMPDNNRTGDCEDFALTLREKLIADGFEKSNVRFATCYTPKKYEEDAKNNYHAVLIVELFWGKVYVVDYKYCVEFRKFPVEKWDHVLDETGKYWIRMEIR